MHSNSNKKKNCDDTLVYEDRYTLEHWPDEIECLAPPNENTKLW